MHIVTILKVCFCFKNFKFKFFMHLYAIFIPGKEPFHVPSHHFPITLAKGLSLTRNTDCKTKQPSRCALYAN